MSSHPPPQQSSPSPPTTPHLHRHHKKPTSFPDFIFTAFSLFILFTSSSSSSSKPSFLHLHKIPSPILSFPLNPRRFLKIPTMSLPKNPRNHPFANPQSLSDWLKPRLPSDSFASWGVKPGTKNVHNLWLELSEGETVLTDSDPPLRTVEVLVVRIMGKDGKLLVESHQELSDGAVRKRCRPLSEKMKPGESIEGAVYRAVKEELGSILGGDFDAEGSNCVVKIIPNSYVKKVEERVSASYPGLPACYVLHTVDAVVEGLPEAEFCTEEVEEYGESDGKRVADGAVSCKKHYWKWVDSHSIK